MEKQLVSDAPSPHELGSLRARTEAKQRQDRQEPLTRVYWMKTVEQLRPEPSLEPSLGIDD
jgi:hypothetical protein